MGSPSFAGRGEAGTSNSRFLAGRARLRNPDATHSKACRKRHIVPAEPAGRAGGILSGEVGGRREDRALYVFRREPVRLLKRGEQLPRRLENRLTRIGGRRGRSTQAAQDLGHGTCRSVVLDGDHRSRPPQGAGCGGRPAPGGRRWRDDGAGAVERWHAGGNPGVDPHAGCRPTRSRPGQ